MGIDNFTELIKIKLCTFSYYIKFWPHANLAILENPSFFKIFLASFSLRR